MIKIDKKKEVNTLYIDSLKNQKSLEKSNSETIYYLFH